MKALRFLVLLFGAWQLYIMFDQLLQKWDRDWIVFTLLAVCFAAKLETVLPCSLISLIWQKPNQCW